MRPAENLAPQRPSTSEAVSVRSLSKTYGEVEVLTDISLTIERGEVFGLLGPNGAGKTTLLECIVGLRGVSSGDIRVLGLDPTRNRQALTQRVAIQPQSATLFNTLTVSETVKLFASFHRNPLASSHVLGQLDLLDQSRVRVKNLSGGQMRRLVIAVALVTNPEVIILDEPSAGVDPIARQRIWAIIAELQAAGTTVILSTHHMDEATTLCNRVAIVVNGRIVALDAPSELIRQRNADSAVSFSVATAAQLAAVQEFLAPASVTSESASRGIRVHAKTSDPDALLRKLTFARSFSAFDFEVSRSSLDDLFLELSATTVP